MICPTCGAQRSTPAAEPPPTPLAIGDIVHGHLFGHFGRDYYDCARVEALGYDWVVIRTFGGAAWTGSGEDILIDVARDRRADPYANHGSGCPADRDDGHG